jgi:hypothetical protein
MMDEKPKKSFSERYFDGLEGIEKALGEAREVMRSADMFKFLQEEREEREKLRDRVSKLEGDNTKIRRELAELKKVGTDGNGNTKGSGAQE